MQIFSGSHGPIINMLHLLINRVKISIDTRKVLLHVKYHYTLGVVHVLLHFCTNSLEAKNNYCNLKGYP